VWHTPCFPWNISSINSPTHREDWLPNWLHFWGLVAKLTAFLRIGCQIDYIFEDWLPNWLHFRLQDVVQEDLNNLIGSLHLIDKLLQHSILGDEGGTRSSCSLCKHQIKLLVQTTRVVWSWLPWTTTQFLPPPPLRFLLRTLMLG